jgi:hypothetical protein
MNPRSADECPQSSPYAEALQANIIIKQTAHSFQALAAVQRDMPVSCHTPGKQKAQH